MAEIQPLPRSVCSKAYWSRSLSCPLTWDHAVVHARDVALVGAVTLRRVAVVGGVAAVRGAVHAARGRIRGTFLLFVGVLVEQQRPVATADHGVVAGARHVALTPPVDRVVGGLFAVSAEALLAVLRRGFCRR